jgi:hypothetical protein
VIDVGNMAVVNVMAGGWYLNRAVRNVLLYVEHSSLCFHLRRFLVFDVHGSMHRNTGCPTRYRTRHFFNNITTNEDIATKFEVDLPHCVRNVKETNVLLFKFRCNIFIGVIIIK